MQRKKALIVLGILFGLNALAFGIIRDLNQEELEIIFFDVGQGDSILIELKNYQILIDGGPDSTVIEKLGETMPFYDREIELLILTHPDHDHITGLIEVLKRYEVANILWTGAVKDTAEFREWQKLIEEEQAQIHLAQAGQQIEHGPILLKVLYPFESLAGQETSEANNTSIVAQLVFGHDSFLFTGDIYQSVEKALIGKAELMSTVLKVAHHGSKTSSGEEFIEAVNPQIAVISAGKDNSYGHPHPETLETLEKHGIIIFRTDLDGDIKLIVNRYKNLLVEYCNE